jgi:hypothetical protein
LIPSCFRLFILSTFADAFVAVAVVRCCCGEFFVVDFLRLLFLVLGLDIFGFLLAIGNLQLLSIRTDLLLDAPFQLRLLSCSSQCG